MVALSSTLAPGTIPWRREASSITAMSPCWRFVMTTVPDFFQDESEEALRSQVEWQEQHLGLGDRFFARLLREDQHRFSSWGKEGDVLTREKEDVLRDWWRTLLHLLAF